MAAIPKIHMISRNAPENELFPPGYVERVRVHFDRRIDFSKTARRRQITSYIDLTVDPPSLRLLYRYMKQTAPSIHAMP